MAQRIPPAAGEDVLESPVGLARVGERRGAGQLGPPQALELAIDVRIHPRHEERRDRPHVERKALLVAALQRLDVRLRDRLIRLNRKQQRDVDVDPLVQSLLDRGRALGSTRDLDHHVGAVEPLPVVAHLCQRALGVVRELRRHLERHEPVVAAGLAVHVGEHVGGHLDVLHGDPLVYRERLQVFARHRLEVLVVIGRPQDRLLEDRWVRGHAAQTFLGDHPRQLAALDQRPADLVEPDADAGLGEALQPRVDLGGRAHQVPPFEVIRFTTSRPVSATRSAVKPKCL